MTMADQPPMLPLAVLALVTALYLWAAGVDRMTGKPRWSPWRTASWLAGAAVLAIALLPGALPFPAGDLRQHMVQHLLIGMLAPLGLVMAAPVTLALRTMPRASGRVLVRLLRSPAMRVWTHPVTALVLNLGGMAALYFTPLYTGMMAHPALHGFVHLHFLAAGCLYVWSIAGPDPVPHRLSVGGRLIVLGVAVVLHSVMAQMLYAGLFVRVPAPPDQLRQAAELMYYGGDITEMLLAFALVSTWRPGRAGAAASFPTLSRKAQSPC